MPWCDPCARFYSPNSVDADGRCPTCGEELEAPEKVIETSNAKIPWHFWLLLAGVVLYLGWRVVQGVSLLV